jgi:uncharacterized protein (UPF0261 family)
LIPTLGFDSYAVAGEPFYDPKADAAFTTELKACLPVNIEVIEQPTHINDPAFATSAAQALIRLMEARPTS